MPGTFVGSLTRSITAPAAAQVSLRPGKGRVQPAPDPLLAAEFPLTDTIQVVVEDGESLSDVAARLGVSTASLIALNGLSWHSTPSTGDLLLVRPGAPAEAPTSSPDDDVRYHRVATGETAADIAARHGVAPAALLLANGLSRTSPLRPGQHLVLPSRSARRPSEPIVLTGDMRANAAVVVAVGRGLGVPDDGLVVALVAAMQDSCLHNLGFGEDDAVGVFQQCPSAGWGSRAELLDVRRAAIAFFNGPLHAVATATGLLEVPGWEFMAVGDAAAAVQRTSTPAAYGKWERCARAWLAELTPAADRQR
jgi:LysM repeat protein